jgi:hypothetical protein
MREPFASIQYAEEGHRIAAIKDKRKPVFRNR